MIALVAALLAAQASGPGPVVVFPTEGKEPEAAWVGEALADLLPRDLGLLGIPVVERADRLTAQEALAIPPAPLTRATCLRIAEALGASRVVVGSHEAEADGLTLSLRLLDVGHGTLSAPLRASGPKETLAELIHALAWDVALAGPARPTRTKEDLLARQTPVPFAAFQAYFQGLAAPDAATRRETLKRALELAPSYDEARLTLGRLQLQARDHGAAYETLARVAVASPANRQARFLQGVALVELGRYREAAGLYAGLAGEEPSPAVLNNHAVAMLRAGPASGVRASEELRKAAELAPGDWDVPFNLGWALLAEGDAEAAAFWLRGVVQQQPKDLHARVALTWALRRSGRGDEADEEWKEILAKAPSFASLATPDLGRRFERLLPSERLVALDQEGRSDAELAAVHLGRAGRIEEGGDHEGALRELMQAVYLDPYGARGHLLLARAYRATGEPDKALGELRVSLWCREDVAVRLELAGLLRERGLGAEARAEAQRVLKADPASAAARAFLEKP